MQFPNFDPFESGLGVAHDILEHYSDPTGGTNVSGEIWALGHALFVRKFYQLRNGIEDGIALDITSLFEETLRGEYGSEFVSCNCAPPSHWMDEVFLGIMRKAFESIVTDGEAEEKLTVKNLKACIDWFRVGYTAAEERYGEGNTLSALSLFVELEEIFKKTIYGAYVGKVMEVYHDIDEFACHVIVRDEYDFYDDDENELEPETWSTRNWAHENIEELETVEP